MATAKKVPIEVVVEQPFKVVLELSKEEALTLHAMTMLVGGNESTTYRGPVQAINRALMSIGVDVGSGALRFTGTLEAKYR